MKENEARSCELRVVLCVLPPFDGPGLRAAHHLAVMIGSSARLSGGKCHPRELFRSLLSIHGAMRGRPTPSRGLRYAAPRHHPEVKSGRSLSWDAFQRNLSSYLA